MKQKEKIREIVRRLDIEDEMPPEVEEFIVESLDPGSTGLSIDEGLEVIVRRLPGDAFAAPHPHMPDEDTLVLHLTPRVARQFDEKFHEFYVEWIIEMGEEAGIV